MKTIIFFLLFAVVQINFAQQIVDTNFAKAIKAYDPMLIDDSFNLTEKAKTAIFINVSNFNIENLSGIEGFSALQYLYCFDNKLTNLPTLPNTLQFLNCHNNRITNLPTLPNQLIGLTCDSNELTYLPTLPSSLLYLYCFNNRITNLPKLPSGLIDLYCEDNRLISLPSLSDSLKYLYVFNNGSLNCLPVLPKGLIKLFAFGTNISCLPNKPDRIADAFANFPNCSADVCNDCTCPSHKPPYNNGVTIKNNNTIETKDTESFLTSDFLKINNLTPNPTDYEIVVSLSSSSEISLDWRIINMVGQTVLSEKRKVKKDLNDIHFDVSEFLSGCYLVYSPQINFGKPLKFIKN